MTSAEKAEYNRRWRKAHPNYLREWRERNRERVREYWRDYVRRFPERIREWRKKESPELRAMRRFKYEMSLCMDAEKYAKKRKQDRQRQKKATDRKIAAGLRPPRVLNGGFYKPRYSIRLPDWCVKGQFITDVRSQWLAENLTATQRAYARELAIERRQWREDNEGRAAL